MHHRDHFKAIYEEAVKRAGIRLCPVHGKDNSNRTSQLKLICDVSQNMDQQKDFAAEKDNRRGNKLLNLLKGNRISSKT